MSPSFLPEHGTRNMEIARSNSGAAIAGTPVKESLGCQCFFYPGYPGNSVIDIQQGPLPNGTVSSRVNAPESWSTRKMAIWPESWPAE